MNIEKEIEKKAKELVQFRRRDSIAYSLLEKMSNRLRETNKKLS